MKTSPSSATVIKHMKNQHSRKKTSAKQLLFRCDQCLNKTFSRKKALQLHQIRTHNYKNPITNSDGMDRY